MPDTIVIGGTQGVAPTTGYGVRTTNFDQTVTALVSRTIQTNLRKVVRYMGAGGFISGKLVPGTDKIRYVSYGDLPVLLPAVAPGTPPWLIEGKRPDLEALTIGYEEFAANQAGRLVGISDIALEYNPNDLFSIAAERVAYNAMATLDQSIAAKLHAGTANTQFVTGSTSTVTITSSMPLTVKEIRKAVLNLKLRNVPTFPDGYYHAFIHPSAVYDLQSEIVANGGTWLEASKYGEPEQLFTGEIGRLYGVRFIETPVGTDLGQVGVGGTNKVLSTFVFGPEAWAFGDVQSVRTYMVRPGGDHFDPLAQLAEVGWKAMWGAVLLGAATSVSGGVKYVRIETGSSLN